MEEIVHVRRVAYCPHCGNRAPQKLIHKQRYLERAWASDGGETDPIPWSTFVAACETCHNVLLYDNMANQLEDIDFTIGELIYPNAGQLRSSVPSVIRQIYEEAWRIKELAPNAFAVQIRRALEALCEDRGAHGSNLQKRLSNLAEKGEIPLVLAEAGDILRLIGNIGAHASSNSVHPLMALTIDEFFRAIIEYVYIAPQKLRDFKDRMNMYSKSEVND